MVLDPTKHVDWEIAEDSEKRMKPIAEIAEKWGSPRMSYCPTATSSQRWTSRRS